MDRENLARARPWMLMMPPETPPYVAVSKNGELLPEVKHLISILAKIRTIDTNGRMVLATGHATPEEHLLLAREGRSQGLNVLLTHPGDIPQLAEAGRLGAFAEITASNVYKTDAQATAAAALVKRSAPSTSSSPPTAARPAMSTRPTAWRWQPAGCAPMA